MRGPKMYFRPLSASTFPAKSSKHIGLYADEALGISGKIRPVIFTYIIALVYMVKTFLVVLAGNIGSLIFKIIC